MGLCIVQCKMLLFLWKPSWKSQAIWTIPVEED